MQESESKRMRRDYRECANLTERVRFMYTSSPEEWDSSYSVCVPGGDVDPETGFIASTVLPVEISVGCRDTDQGNSVILPWALLAQSDWFRQIFTANAQWDVTAEIAASITADHPYPTVKLLKLNEPDDPQCVELRLFFRLLRKSPKSSLVDEEIDQVNPPIESLIRLALLWDEYQFHLPAPPTRDQ